MRVLDQHRPRSPAKRLEYILGVPLLEDVFRNLDIQTPPLLSFAGVAQLDCPCHETLRDFDRSGTQVMPTTHKVLPAFVSNAFCNQDHSPLSVHEEGISSIPVREEVLTLCGPRNAFATVP